MFGLRAENTIPEQSIVNLPDQNEVNAIINGFKNSRSTGWDKITTKVINAVYGRDYCSFLDPIYQ